jgi:hypothetical protein
MRSAEPDNDEAVGARANSATALVQGEDYYLEDGLMVFTADYLLRRGYCCENGCRSCPYGNVTAEVSEARP